MNSNHFQSFITLAAADWVCVQPAPRGWKVVRIQGVRVEQLDAAPTRGEAEVLAQTYAVVIAAGLAGVA
jgi:hypothetical protein